MIRVFTTAASRTPISVTLTLVVENHNAVEPVTIEVADTNTSAMFVTPRMTQSDAIVIQDLPNLPQ